MGQASTTTASGSWYYQPKVLSLNSNAKKMLSKQNIFFRNRAQMEYNNCGNNIRITSTDT